MATSQKRDLVEVKGLRSSLGYFKEKEFLSMEEIYQSLQNRWLNYAGRDMKDNLERVRSDVFLSFPVEFPVTRLQHTTTETPMRKILESQSFKGRNPEESDLRAELKDLSFWAPDTSAMDTEQAREAAYTYVQEDCPGLAEEYREEITQQFANSPAFNKSASRYGNFTFSLPLYYLLSLYGNQFCNGEKPQLSILGTDIYKLEIVHNVVVHSPDETRFMDFPRVPTLQTRGGNLPCVYWMGDTLYWRPQSTTDNLKVLTKNGQITGCNQPEPCDWYETRGSCVHTVKCVWNLLTFAFHIPDGRTLEIPVQMLTDNLSACDALKPFMKEESEKVGISRAEAIIKKVMQQYQEDKDSKPMEQ